MDKRSANEGKIFLSYRSSDTGSAAGRIFDRLSKAFPQQVFFDTETIDPGADFVAKLEEEVRSCSVFVPIIGKAWKERLELVDASGRDFVAHEVDTALKSNRHILPILIDDAQMPDRSELPERVRGLVDLNALSIRHRSFERDTKNLIDAISFMLGRKPVVQEERWPPGARKAWIGAVFFSLLLVPITASNPQYYFSVWQLANPLIVMPAVVGSVSLLWPIPTRWAVAHVVVMLTIVMLVSPTYAVLMTQGAVRVVISPDILLLIAVALVVNIALAAVICRRFYRR